MNQVPQQYQSTPYPLVPQKSPWRSVATTAWILSFLICIGAVLPWLGFIGWLFAIPLLIVIFVLAIVVLAKGGTMEGIGLLIMALVGLPVVLAFGPIIGTGIFHISESPSTPTKPTAAAPTPTPTPTSFDQLLSRMDEAAAPTPTPTAAPAALTTMRDWTDSKGQTIKAQLLSAAKDSAGLFVGTFKKPDGSEFSYHIGKLGEPDKSFLRSLFREKGLE